MYAAATGEVLTARFADDCLTLDLDGDEKKGCGDEEIAEVLSELLGTELTAEDLQGAGAASGSTCRPAEARPAPQLGFVTIRRDGAWYVSPSRTMLDTMTESLRQLDRASLDCIRDSIEEQLGGLDLFGGMDEPPADLGDSTFEPPTTDAPFDGAASDTVPFDTVPFDTVPFDAASSDTVPPDTVPFDTAPPDTLTFDTVPPS